MSPRISISETPSGRSRGRSRRTASGICSNSWSTLDRPMARSMLATSSSVCGANLMPDVQSSRKWRSPGPRREGPARSAGDVLEAVLRHQRQVVTLVEDLAVDAGVQLAQAADLPVLLGHQSLVERRDLDVQVVLGKVEVGREPLHHVAVPVPLEIERRGLVLPVDLIEVQELRELAFAGVRERHRVARQGRDVGLGGSAHAPPAARAPRVFFPALLARVPSSSVHTLSTAIAKTPCPLASRSTTASGDST